MLLLGAGATIKDVPLRSELQRSIRAARIRLREVTHMQQLRTHYTHITLRVIWQQYKATGRLKHTTERDYEKRLNLCLADWLDIPVSSLSKDQVEQRHAEISVKAAAQANLVMRILKALLTFAATKYDGIFPSGNPVHRLSEVRAWNRIKRRRTVILPHQMAPWFRAALRMNNPVVRDYFMLVLLSGLRKMEAATLRWDLIDFEHRTLTVLDTKNHEDHQLPLSDQLYALLRNRRRHSNGSEYVFPGKVAGTHLTDWRHSHDSLIAASGVDFMVHDLRRTFLTVADSLEIPMHVIKILANHKTRSVTEGYIVPSIERLRNPMQQISDAITRQCMQGMNDEDLELVRWLTDDSGDTIEERLAEPFGILESEILQRVSAGTKRAYTIRELWCGIREGRAISYDAVGTTVRRLCRKGYLEPVETMQSLLTANGYVEVPDETSRCKSYRLSDAYRTKRVAR